MAFYDLTAYIYEARKLYKVPFTESNTRFKQIAFTEVRCLCIH